MNQGSNVTESILSGELYKNPKTKTVYWKSKHKGFMYYQKPAEGSPPETQGENINLGVDICFIPLAILTSVNGFHKPLQCGIYSNEVAKSTDLLEVKITYNIANTTKTETKALGTWENVKGKLSGMKYTKAVYGYDLKEKCLVLYQFTGAATGAWIDMVKNARKVGLTPTRSRMYVLGTSFYLNDEGEIPFNVPILQANSLGTDAKSSALWDEALVATKTLMEYLNQALPADQERLRDKVMAMTQAQVNQRQQQYQQQYNLQQQNYQPQQPQQNYQPQQPQTSMAFPNQQQGFQHQTGNPQIEGIGNNRPIQNGHNASEQNYPVVPQPEVIEVSQIVNGNNGNNGNNVSNDVSNKPPVIEEDDLPF